MDLYRLGHRRIFANNGWSSLFCLLLFWRDVTTSCTHNSSRLVYDLLKRLINFPQTTIKASISISVRYRQFGDNYYDRSKVKVSVLLFLSCEGFFHIGTFVSNMHDRHLCVHFLNQAFANICLLDNIQRKLFT